MQTLTQHGGEHRGQKSPPTDSTSAFQQLGQEFLSCYGALSKAGCEGMSVCSSSSPGLNLPWEKQWKPKGQEENKGSGEGLCFS